MKVMPSFTVYPADGTQGGGAAQEMKSEGGKFSWWRILPILPQPHYLLASFSSGANPSSNLIRSSSEFYLDQIGIPEQGGKTAKCTHQHSKISRVQHEKKPL